MRDATVIAGRYRLDARIGEGGMSTVWRGTDLSLSREVAVKILRDEVAAQPEAVSRFRREAHAAAKLNHPNVVQIYDTGVDGSTYYIVMEYLAEPDLKRIIKDWAPLPEGKVIEVATQCCRALSYAHRNGIVHRDVKPHNILFTEEGRVKLSDFGIAAAAGTGGVGPGGFVLGSAHYMSPEQTQGSPAGPHSDLYSLGCVMYEALTGRTPYQGREEAEIAAKHLRERPPSLRGLNPRISPATEYLVNKAMAREVARRYRSAEEMLGDLEKVAAGEELDRTGVLTVAPLAPEGATSVLQPMPPSREGMTVALPQAEPPRSLRAVAPPAAPTAAPPVLRPPSETRSTAWGALTATIVALLALAVVLWLGKTLFYPGANVKMVQVPLVKGRTSAEAREELERAHLVVGDLKFRSSSDQPEGTVLSQSPEGGQTVQAGAKVDLVLNRGYDMVPVIKVDGMELGDAVGALQSVGLNRGEVTQKYHATIPAGRVIRQAVKAGTKVEKGTGIDLEVSKGPEPPANTAPLPPAANEVAPVASEPPHVTVDQDESYSPANPTERRFIVTVTAQGQEMGQRIQIREQDDSGGRAVLTVKLNPNETRQVPVITRGPATIQVLYNDHVVYNEAKPLPAGVGTPAGGGKSREGSKTPQ